MREHLRDLLAIDQRWRARTRKRDKPVIVIYQVKRGPDCEVYAYREGDDPSRTGALFRVSFAELRRCYRLLPGKQGGEHR